MSIKRQRGLRDYEKQIHDLNVTIIDLKSDIESFKTQVGGINSKDFERLKNAYDALNGWGRTDLKQQNDELKRQNGDFKKQNIELQRKLTDLESRLEDVERKVK